MAFENKNEVLKKCAVESLELCQKYYNLKNWVYHSKKRGCLVYTHKIEKNDYYAVKGEITITTKKTPKEIINQCSEYYVHQHDTYAGFLKEADPLWVSYECIHKLDASAHFGVYHTQYTANNFLVANRDFIFIRKVEHLENCSMWHGKSLDENIFKNLPAKPKCVRGEAFSFGWRCSRIDENNLKVEFLTHTSPKGWIPIKVFNFLATDGAYVALRVVEYMKKGFLCEKEEEKKEEVNQKESEGIKEVEKQEKDKKEEVEGEKEVEKQEEVKLEVEGKKEEVKQEDVEE